EGNFSFVAQVRDRYRLTAERRFSLAVFSPEARGAKQNEEMSRRMTVSGNWPNHPVTRGEKFTVALQAAGGSGALRWSVPDLPKGLTLDAAYGFIDGTPLQTGTFHLTVRVSDSQGRSGERRFSLVVH